MTERKSLPEQGDTPDDVATLYSWANLHGAKYRDFSASRAQMREKARERVQQAIAEEQERARKDVERREAEEAAAVAKETADADAERIAAAQREAESARAADARRQAEQAAEQAAQYAAQQAHLAAQQRAWQQPRPPERPTAFPPAAPLASPPQNPVYPQPAPLPTVPAFSQPPTQAPAHSAPGFAPPAPAFPPPAFPAQAFPPQPSYLQQTGTLPHYAALREEASSRPQNTWAPTEPRENVSLPAWLASERSESAAPPQAAPPQSASPQEDTLQSSRDRLTSRWFALKGVLDGANDPGEIVQAPAPAAVRAPVLAVFSLAGGVGKTSLLATLGRSLSSRGERVLLVDTATYGVLPFFFGARDQRPGVLRTFSPPGASGDAPIQMITLDPEGMGSETPSQESLTQEISRLSNGSSRVLVDLATASGAVTRRILRMAPIILVPVIPDMNSMVSVSAIESFFRHNGNAGGKQILPFYILNQFDYSLPLHLDVREVLRQQVGERMLPFVIRRAPAINEALAEGMTVVDYAPNSTAAEDFASLANWLKSVAAPATAAYRGVRWSER